MNQITESKAFEIVGRQQVEIVVLRERVALLEANLAARDSVDDNVAVNVDVTQKPKRVK